jgi:hypothetical protein
LLSTSDLIHRMPSSEQKRPSEFERCRVPAVETAFEFRRAKEPSMKRSQKYWTPGVEDTAVREVASEMLAQNPWIPSSRPSPQGKCVNGPGLLHYRCMKLVLAWRCQVWWSSSTVVVVTVSVQLERRKLMLRPWAILVRTLSKACPCYLFTADVFEGFPASRP